MADNIKGFKTKAGILKYDYNSLDNLPENVGGDTSNLATVDMDNLSNAGKSYMSGIGMPSNRCINLTLGASDTTYTAPANGYYVIRKNASAVGQFIYIGIRGGLAHFISRTSGLNNEAIEFYFPCKKNDLVAIAYNLGGATGVFKFVYAEGSQGE